MLFLRKGIEDIRTITLPDAVAADGRCGAISRAALVMWRSSLEGMLYQVYVNGRLAGATIDTEQRQLVIQSPTSFQSAVRIEVVAVEPREAHVDFAREIGRYGICSARVKLMLLRSQDLPAEATMNIYFDNGIGEVDYAEPLNASPIPIWPCRQDKAGFGMAQFGTADFGYESAAAVGIGKGYSGYGQFGLDADVIEWISPALPLGRYRFGVMVLDEHGNESSASETEPIAVIPPARPAAALHIVTFDENSNQLKLSVLDQA